MLKKCLFLVTACLVPVGALAHTALKPEQVSAFVQMHEGPRPADTKPWQLIMVLNLTNLTPWSTLEDTRHTLEEQIIQGHLARAAVLYSTQAGDTFLDVYSAETLSTPTPDNAPSLGKEAAKIKHHYPRIDTQQKDEPTVLRQLFSGFAKQGYYTAVVLEMHGAGDVMTSYIGGEHPIYPALVVDALAQSGLPVDVLFWESCYMGTVGNLYYLFQHTPTRYVVTASNQGGTNAEKRNGLLHLFHLPPAQIVQQFNALYGTVPNVPNTNNSLVVDGKAFRRLLSPVLAQWARLATPTPLAKTLFAQAASPKELVFEKVLLHFIQAAPPGTLRAASQRLLKYSGEVVLSYRCYDTHLRQLFTAPQDVPAESDCAEGLVLDPASLRTLQGDLAASATSAPDTAATVRQHISQQIARPHPF